MQPLAERMRPLNLDDYIGQQHLVGEGAVIRRMIDQRRISSFILWGPPGVGKTTLANIIAKTDAGISGISNIIDPADIAGTIPYTTVSGKPTYDIMSVNDAPLYSYVTMADDTDKLMMAKMAVSVIVRVKMALI